MIKDQKSDNPVCAVWWRDAAYSFDEEWPGEFPSLQLAVGFVVEANEDYINLATDVEYDEGTGQISPKKGSLIPRGVVEEFKKVGNLHE